MHKICGDVEIAPHVVSAGGCGQEVRVGVVFRGVEGQSLPGSQAVRPGYTFDSPCEAMDAVLLHGQRLLRGRVRGSAPQAGVAI